jgi:hypothetical protein
MLGAGWRSTIVVMAGYMSMSASCDAERAQTLCRNAQSIARDAERTSAQIRPLLSHRADNRKCSRSARDAAIQFRVFAGCFPHCTALRQSAAG